MICSLVFVGDSKDEVTDSIFNEYKKMLSSTLSVEEIRVKPCKSSGSNMSVPEIKKCVEKEGEAILSVISDSKYSKCEKVAMCIEGKELSSEEFASFLEKANVSGKNGFVFIIGGSWGLSEKVKTFCDAKISFSRMTFPHKLFKVMLAEQIYRGFSIIQGKKYHK